MKRVVLLLLACSGMFAQDLTVALHDPTGTVADAPISSAYPFPNTPVGSAASIVIRIRDNAGQPVQIISVLVTNGISSLTADTNFTVSGQQVDKTLSTGSGSFEDVTVSFAPLSQGAQTGYGQIVYQVQSNGCSFSSTTSPCPSLTENFSTLSGTATAPQVVLSYAGASGSVILQPASATPLDFGNVSTSATKAITFTLTNETGAALTTPTVGLTTAQFNSTAFALNTQSLPATIAAGASGTFTVTFAPGQVGLTSATLTIGSLPFPLVGTGAVVADIDALQIAYVDSTGVRTLPQAGTPIAFGQVVAGTTTGATLSVYVTNPTTSWNAVTLQTLAVTGAGFALVSAPAVPVSIAPGTTIQFGMTFLPTTTGSYSGTLSIGTRQFSLAGSSITSALPTPRLQISQSPLTSGQQVSVTVQLGAASTVSAIGQLSLSFVPQDSAVSDDPAIVFVATGGRNLQVTVTPGAQAATYSGQTAIAMQTGTTAGTLTLTITFPNQAPVTQSFTIAGEKIQISAGTAVRQNPNLVISLTAFDNTYSAGKLSFTFYDTKGNVMTANPIALDATSEFASYFKTTTAGGSFAIQASFPVTGDITQVGSVAVQMINSVGTASVNETFQ